MSFSLAGPSAPNQSTNLHPYLLTQTDWRLRNRWRARASAQESMDCHTVARTACLSEGGWLPIGSALRSWRTGALVPRASYPVPGGLTTFQLCTPQCNLPMLDPYCVNTGRSGIELKPLIRERERPLLVLKNQDTARRMTEMWQTWLFIDVETINNKPKPATVELISIHSRTAYHGGWCSLSLVSLSYWYNFDTSPPWNDRCLLASCSGRSCLASEAKGPNLDNFCHGRSLEWALTSESHQGHGYSGFRFLWRTDASEHPGKNPDRMLKNGLQ